MPPLSIATIVGVFLFLLYVGSAMMSSIPWTVMWNSLVGNSYAIHKEHLFCQELQKDIAGKMVYVFPSGTMKQRLEAISMVAEFGKQIDALTVVVWNDENGNPLTPEPWAEMFQSPDVQPGCFPGLSRVVERAACDVQEVGSREDLQDVWEQQPDQTDVLCLKTAATEIPADEEFVTRLRPSLRLEDEIQSLKKEVHWVESDTFVGIQLMKSDLKILCEKSSAEDTATCSDNYESAIQKYLDAVQETLGSGRLDGKNVRILLLADDWDIEDRLILLLESASKRFAQRGAIIAYKGIMHGKSNLSLLDERKENVLDLWLLKDCDVVIGREGSQMQGLLDLFRFSGFVGV